MAIIDRIDSADRELPDAPVNHPRAVRPGAAVSADAAGVVPRCLAAARARDDAVWLLAMGSRAGPPIGNGGSVAAGFRYHDPTSAPVAVPTETPLVAAASLSAVSARDGVAAASPPAAHVPAVNGRVTGFGDPGRSTLSWALPHTDHMRAGRHETFEIVHRKPCRPSPTPAARRSGRDRSANTVRTTASSTRISTSIGSSGVGEYHAQPRT